jgi:mono/diheme cytochrome c family protein
MNFIEKKLITIFFSLDILNDYNLSNIKKKSSLELFEINCSVCHLHGENSIIPEKNLEKKNLKANGMNSLLAVRYQIKNGKNGMPAFGDRLEQNDIDEIANYILSESFQKTIEKYKKF